MFFFIIIIKFNIPLICRVQPSNEFYDGDEDQDAENEQIEVWSSYLSQENY